MYQQNNRNICFVLCVKNLIGFNQLMKKCIKNIWILRGMKKVCDFYNSICYYLYKLYKLFLNVLNLITYLFIITLKLRYMNYLKNRKIYNLKTDVHNI